MLRNKYNDQRYKICEKLISVHVKSPKTCVFLLIY